MSTVNLCVCVCVFSAFAQHNCILRLNDKISLDICMCVCVRACMCLYTHCEADSNAKFSNTGQPADNHPNRASPENAEPRPLTLNRAREARAVLRPV